MDLELKLGRDPEEYEVAQAMNLSLDDYRIMLGEVSHLGCVSLNETLDDSQEGSSFLDSLEDERPDISPGAKNRRSTTYPKSSGSTLSTL